MVASTAASWVEPKAVKMVWSSAVLLVALWVDWKVLWMAEKRVALLADK